MTKQIHILAISGSIRNNSSNTKLAQAIAKLMPGEISYSIYPEIDKIPLFDESDDVPEPVTKFRNAVESADAVLFCSPEYAFGVSGVLKNVIDWTVSSGEFYDKPVAIITAAINGEKAHEALLNIMDALGAKVIERATLIIPFIRTKLNLEAEITDNKTLEEVKSVIKSLSNEIQLNN